MKESRRGRLIWPRQGDVGCFIFVMRTVEAFVEGAVTAHGEDHARAGIDAGKGQREKAGHRAGLERNREPRHTVHAGKYREGAVNGVERNRFALIRISTRAQHLGVGDKDEEQPGNDKAPDDRAGD